MSLVEVPPSPIQIGSVVVEIRLCDEDAERIARQVTDGIARRMRLTEMRALTRDEVMEILQCDAHRLVQLERDGILVPFRLDRFVRYSNEAVYALLNGRRP